MGQQSPQPQAAGARFNVAERFLGLAVILGLLVLIVSIVGAVVLNNRSRKEVQDRASARAVASTDITLVIDFGDHSQRRFSDLKFTQSMTVLDAMNAAAAHPRAPKFAFTGSGETAFVSEIDGVKNEGGGEKNRNWQFWVNSDFAHASAGATTIKAGDRITWIYDIWRETPIPPRQ